MNPIGAIVCGSTDGGFFYCVNRDEKLHYPFLDTCPENDKPLDVELRNKASKVFTVTPGVLGTYR